MKVNFEPVCYSVNSTAMGDILAAVPVVKYAIETYHKECDYRVVASTHFRPFFHFVPDSKFFALEDETWTFDKPYSIRKLNDLSNKGKNVCRLTPSKMTLSHYASIGLMGRILQKDAYNYIPLQEVDVSHFGIDFSNSVLIVASFRDENRSIRENELLKISEYLHNRSITPIYVGKTDKKDKAKGKWRGNPSTSPFTAPSYGIDLRNKTSIPELASIISKSLAVVGVDSGILHLAGTTKTPIIASYTNVDWKFRLPVRKEGTTLVVEPDSKCRYCSSHWLMDFYNFANCYTGKFTCVNSLTADKYITALEMVLGKSIIQALSFDDAWEKVKPCYLGKEKLSVLHTEMLMVKDIKGDIAEIGVYKGSTSQFMHLTFPERHLHCFDSFCGVKNSESIDYYKDGEFSASLEEVKDRVGNNNVSYHKVVFPTNEIKDSFTFSFVHIDLDTYIGTKSALNYVFKFMASGGTILVDDYNSPNCKGVEKAFMEWRDNHKVECIVKKYKRQYAIAKR